MALDDILADLGYGDFKTGVCFGVAHSAKRAILMENTDEFNALLAICDQNSSQKIKKLIENAFRSDIETPTVNLYKKLPDFLKSIGLYQGQDQCVIKYGKESTWYKQDAIYTETYLLPESLKIAVGHTSRSFSGIYAPDGLHCYFLSLQQHLEGIEYPVAIVMNSSNHAITIGYLPKEKQWIIFGSQSSLKFTHAKHVADMVTPVFLYQLLVPGSLNSAANKNILDSAIIAFASTVYVLKTNEASFNQRIDGWMKSPQWLSIHTLSPEKIHLTDSHGITWAWVATKMGLTESVYDLLQAGADPRKCCGKQDISLLGVAALAGHIEIINMLMKYVSPNETFSSRKITPLHLAAQNLQSESVQALLDGGADPDITSADGHTPLSVAARFGGIDVLKILIANGAKLQYTFIIFCVRQGFDKVLEFFLENHFAVATAPICIDTKTLDNLFSSLPDETKTIQRRKRLFLEAQTASNFHITPYQFACIIGKGVMISCFITSNAVPDPMIQPIYQKFQQVIKQLEGTTVGSSSDALQVAKDLRFLYLCFGTLSPHQISESLKYDYLAHIFTDPLIKQQYLNTNSFIAEPKTVDPNPNTVTIPNLPVGSSNSSPFFSYGLFSTECGGELVEKQLPDDTCTSNTPT